jgi:hypothetical protein
MFGLLQEREMGSSSRDLQQATERRVVRDLGCDPHHVVRHNENHDEGPR